MQRDLVARLRAAGCVYAEDEARLLLDAARTPDELDSLLARRVAGEPLEQVLGWAAFCGLRILVDPGVFVPRRRTEFLVHEAVAVATAGDIVCDLCCGSGAVGAAVAAAVPGVEVHAADLDPVAVRCARRNLGRQVYQGDLYAALPVELRGRLAVVIANAPYVPTDAILTMPPEARLHEPRVALDGGADGLAVLRRVIAGADEWLTPAGHVLVESSRAQAPALAEYASAAGLATHIAAREDSTVVIAQRVSAR
jgi:release factor glutamine methyltransferase